MNVWLRQNARSLFRFLVSIVIIFWLTMMTFLVFAFNDSMTSRVDAQFRALQEDHREQRRLLTNELMRFGLAIQRNTDQTKANSEVIKELSEDSK